MIKRMQECKRWLVRVVDFVGGLCFVLMFLSITLQIFARNFLRMPFSWTEEFARFFYVWTVFVGAVAITADDEHIRIEIISSALPEKVQHIITIIGNLLAMVFCGFVIQGGIRLTNMNRGFFFPSLPHFMTFSMLYVVVPISVSLIMALLTVKTLLLIWNLFFPEKEAPGSAGEEGGALNG